MIRTARLLMIPCDEVLLRAIVAGAAQTGAHVSAGVPDGWPEYPEAYVHALEKTQREGDLRPWWTWVFVDDERGVLVGSGGFSGKPTPEGIVELGYETALAFRGLGYATEAAAGLLAFAFSREEVKAVDAHTLPEKNASVRVLERNGFRQVGVAEDPDAGTVWHWRVTRAEWDALPHPTPIQYLTM